MEDTRYKTFWRRTGALFIDGLILRPLTYASPDLKPGIGMDVVFLGALLSIASVAYGTVMHAKYGATVGKMAAGVIVLREDRDEIPGWRKALQRDSLNYGMVAGAVLIEAMVVRMNTESERFGIIVLGSALLFAALGILLAELLSALTNPRRRSLHDLIAGTIVVKTSFYTDEAVRRMRRGGHAAPELRDEPRPGSPGGW